MIGNDVIDLKTAKKESNWQRKGFLDKLFTSFEQDLIKKASNQEHMVWMLWSLKESTYKAYQRIHYNRGFYPIKIEIQSLKLIGSFYTSKIALFGTSFYGKTNSNKNTIHSIVVQDVSDFTKIHIIKKLLIQKNHKGLPFCAISNELISISHHGKYKKIIQLKKSI